MADLIVSSDQHMMEPPNMFAERMPKNMRDRTVRIEYPSPRECRAYYPDNPIPRTVIHAQDGLATRNFINDWWDPSDPSSDPVAAAIKDLDADGVAAALLFPNFSLTALHRPDHDLALAHCRAHNDYVAESYNPHSKRFLTSAAIPLTDVDDAIAEIERAVQMGFRAILLPGAAPQPYDSPEYERVWQAASAHGLVITSHTGTGFHWDNHPFFPRNSATPLANSMTFHSVMADDFKLMIMQLVSGGVLQRHPDLHFVLVESNAAWLAELMAIMDASVVPAVGNNMAGEFAGGYGKSTELTWSKFQGAKWTYPMRPSDYVRRQIHVSFMEDPLAIQNRHYTGIDALVWGADYPHAEGTNLQSRASIAFQFAGVPDVERIAMTGGTLAKLFRLETAAV